MNNLRETILGLMKIENKYADFFLLGKENVLKYIEIDWIEAKVTYKPDLLLPPNIKKYIDILIE